mgnify:CR=1 FL=1
MDIHSFWDFALAAEKEYSDYRKQIMQRFDLSAVETDVLLFLANNPGFDTAAQIAKVRRIPKSQVSVAVRSLCDRALLVWSYQPGNRKSVHLALTKQAAPVIAYGRATQEAFGEALFAGFSDAEKAEFVRLHNKIAANIAAKPRE